MKKLFKTSLLAIVFSLITNIMVYLIFSFVNGSTNLFSGEWTSNSRTGLCFIFVFFDLIVVLSIFVYQDVIWGDD